MSERQAMATSKIVMQWAQEESTQVSICKGSGKRAVGKHKISYLAGQVMGGQ